MDLYLTIFVLLRLQDKSQAKETSSTTHGQPRGFIRMRAVLHHPAHARKWTRGSVKTVREFSLEVAPLTLAPSAEYKPSL